MTEHEQSQDNGPPHDHRQLQQAIAALELQRATLGNGVIDAAQAPLRKQLADLGQPSADAPSLAGERKQVTVMFADISGFTPLSETLDPETVRDLVNGCFERLVPIIEHYDGTVDKFMGDSVMVLFGAPIAHENDPERALRTAVDMMAALAEFNAQHGVDLGLHFGINTGLAIAGGLGTQEQQTYSVMGDAVNLAARLEDLSQRGEILVGSDTYRLAAPLFEFAALEPVRVKGKAEPVPVYRLLGPRSRPEPVRGLAHRGISSPLVGRDAELEAIHDCLERLRQGQGGILFITGEAGVGKSRLMAEIREQTLAKVGIPSQGCSSQQWLEGRTLSFGQSISYWPFQEILWRYAAISEDDSEATAWTKLERKIHTLFGDETPEILPYLASLLALEVREEYAGRVKYLDSEAMGRQLYLASRRFFERLAQTQPLVLVFEDLHWADESSALLLEHLMPLAESAPLLICAVSRSYRQTPSTRLQEAARRDHPDCYIELHLEPLSLTDSAQLLHNLLEIEGLPDHVRAQIVAKAGGNPFFLEEIIRTLIDSGAIRHGPTTGRWQATEQLETITIPDTIQGVIMARVDRLDREVKGALRTASVVGRSFLYRVLRAVAEAGRDLDEHLAELQAIELIREKQRIPELEYSFKHALAQAAIYESILLQKRRELHARVGQAIEELFADRLEEFYGLLAYHYARAEAWEKAQAYLLKAGDQAGRVAADAEALANYELAMAAYGRAFGEEWDPLERAALERKMGEALFRRGEHQQALEHFHRALDCLGIPLPSSHWGVRLAILTEAARQLGHRTLPRLFLRGAGSQASPETEEVLRSYEPMAWMAGLTAPERFMLLTLRILNLAQANGLGRGAVAGSMGMGATFDYFPVYWLAEDYYEQALALAQQIEHPNALSLAYTGLAMHSFYVCRWDAVIEHGRKAASICRETGDLHNWGWVSDLISIALYNRGDLLEAVKRSQAVVRMGQDGADPQVQCWSLHTQSEARGRLGQLDEAMALSRQAVALAETIPDHSICLAARAFLGQCYARQGKLEEALSELRKSQQVYAAHPIRWGAPRNLFQGLPEAYLLAAEKGSGTETNGWLKKAKGACSEALKQGRRHPGGLPEAQMIRGRYEWLRRKPRAAARWWQRAQTSAEALGQRYDLGLICLEMGSRMGDRTPLERAEAILSQIGAERDLARARQALRELE